MVLIFLIINIETAISQSIKLRPKDMFSFLPKEQIRMFSALHQVSGMKVTNQNNTWSFKSPYNYKSNLGIVCKWELKMDHYVKNPVRFRLGSYEYVNQLEGK